jgi:hypothetical protein
MDTSVDAIWNHVGVEEGQMGFSLVEFCSNKNVGLDNKERILRYIN